MKHSIASRQPVPASQHTPLCSIYFLPEIICVSIHIRIPAVHHPAICIKSEPVKRTLPLCRIGIWIVDSRPFRSIASTARFKLPASICILPPVSSYYIFRYDCRIRILPGACLSFCQISNTRSCQITEPRCRSGCIRCTASCRCPLSRRRASTQAAARMRTSARMGTSAVCLIDRLILNCDCRPVREATILCFHGHICRMAA